jgi:hypothetical protein
MLRRTGRVATEAATTQPVRPFGRIGTETFSQRVFCASVRSPRTRSVVGRKSLRNCGKTRTIGDVRDGRECAASLAERMTAAFGYVACAAKPGLGAVRPAPSPPRLAAARTAALACVSRPPITR